VDESGTGELGVTILERVPKMEKKKKERNEQRQEGHLSILEMDSDCGLILREQWREVIHEIAKNRKKKGANHSGLRMGSHEREKVIRDHAKKNLWRRKIEKRADKMCIEGKGKGQERAIKKTIERAKRFEENHFSKNKSRRAVGILQEGCLQGKKKKQRGTYDEGAQRKGGGTVVEDKFDGKGVIGEGGGPARKTGKNGTPRRPGQRLKKKMLGRKRRYWTTN